MYCPQCGIESSSNQQYCRSCGANLKVIGKAVTLSEAIARSDRGPLPKIKEMMKSLKINQATEEVSKALEQMNHEVIKSFDSSHPKAQFFWKREPLTPAQRRERAIGRGIRSVFTGVGLSIFLYNFTAAIVLKIPPQDLAQIPFELEPLVHTAWIVGVIPIFSGLGRIISGLLIRPDKRLPEANSSQLSPSPAEQETASSSSPHSITDHTTELLQ